MTVKVNNPKILVLLAAFNGRQWIAEQVESILSQQGVDVTIVISVDSSSDGTEDLVSELSYKNAKVIFLPHGFRFGGAASNFYRLIRDVNFSEFDYIALSDQDDIWLDSKLLNASRAIVSQKVEAYSSNVIAFWPSDRRVVIKKNQKQTEWDFIFEAAGPGCTYVLSRKLALDIQKFVKTNWVAVNKIGLHDWFIYAYARSRQITWFIDGRASILYRQHSTNQVGVNHGWKAFKYRFKKVLSGWAFNQAALIANVLGLSKTPFIEGWSSLNRIGLLRLSLRSKLCRRRTKDQVIFFFSCWLYAMLGRRQR